MKNKIFFLIPDISGFTRFVTQTEISHGQHIISELLEILIDANQLDLTLAEIEGDALLFYKQHQIPPKDRLIKQAEFMFTRFHQHLKKYDGHRICECGACQGAGKLTLKLITHAGSSEFIKVKGQQKPYGQDVILAHRLLKNTVDSDEYLLFSQKYLDNDNSELSSADFPWLDLKQGSSDYESFGTVSYQFCSLSPLREFIQEPKPGSSFKTGKPMVVETTINKPRDEVFEIIIDLKQRMKWNKFANDIEYDPDEINQTGTKHVCVFDSQTIEFESVKADFGSGNLVYGEKILDLPFFAREITLYFIVGHQNGECRVQLQVHYLLKPVLGWVIDPIFRWKNQQINRQVIQHLREYCESR